MSERVRRPGLMALSLVAGASLLRSSMAISVPDPNAARTLTETLPSQTLIQYSKDLPIGQSEVVTVGSSGSVVRTYGITYRNGREVSRTVLDEEVLTEPVDGLILTGNKVTEHGSQTGQA